MEETMNEWVNILTQAASQVNNAPLREEVEAAIHNMIRSNPTEFIAITAAIMANPEIPLLTRQLASILTAQILEPRDMKQLNEIREIWMSPEKEPINTLVKQCLYQTVLIDDPTIRKQAARTFALIFGIEKDKFVGSLSELVDLFDNPEVASMPTALIGIFNTFEEVFSLKNFSEVSSQQYHYIYMKILPFCIHFIGLDYEEANFAIETEIRKMSSECLTKAIENCPDMFHPREIDFCNDILARLPMSFQIPDKDLFNSLHHLMYAMMTSFYYYSLDFVSTVFSYTMRTIASPSENEYKNIAIYFWREVALHEKSIIEAYQRKQNHTQDEPQPLYICAKLLMPDVSGDPLVPYRIFDPLFQIMCAINPAEMEVENLENLEPSMYATMTLEAFHQAAPNEMLELVRKQFEMTICSNNWWEVHASILLVYSILSPPFGPNEYEFLTQIFRHIQENCISYIDRIRETSLFVLGMCFSSYPGLLSKLQRPADGIKEILQLMTVSENLHPTILMRYCTIIYHICAIWNDVVYPSPLEEEFDEIKDKLDTIMKTTAISDLHNGLLTIASEAFNRLIQSAPRIINDKLEAIFVDIVGQLKITIINNELLSNDDIFIQQSALCSNISTIGMKLRKDLGGSCDEAIELLFALCRNQNSILNEEALMALAAMVLCVKKRLGSVYINQFAAIIISSYQTQSTGIINAASLLLSDLFHNLESLMGEHAQTFLDMLFDILESDMAIMHDILPFIIKAIAEIFIGLKEHPEVLEIYKTRLEAQLVHVASTEINTQNPSEVEYANSLYEYLADAYGAYAIVFQNGEGRDPESIAIEKNGLVQMASFVSIVSRIENPSDYVFYAVCRMVKEYGRKTSRRNNVVLNKYCVHQFIKRAMESQNHLLSKFAKETLNYIRSR